MFGIPCNSIEGGGFLFLIVLVLCILILAGFAGISNGGFAGNQSRPGTISPPSIVGLITSLLFRLIVEEFLFLYSEWIAS